MTEFNIRYIDPMKIAINTRLLLKNKLEGIGWFTFETLRRITNQHPEHHFYFIFDRPFDPEFIFSDNITPIVIGPPSRHPVLWYVWFNISIAGVLKKIKPDLFFSPEGYLCLNSNVKSVNVMHDIAYEHFPETVPYTVRLYYRYYFPKFAKKANRIATVSSFSKNDIVNYYHVSPDKIDVVYNGCNNLYHTVTESEKDIARNKYSGGKPYFIYIGGINPRKNIGNLFKGFDRFKTKTGSDAMLLLIGKKSYGSEMLDSLLTELPSGNDIKFLGRIEDIHETNLLISGALALTYVSVFEGFGIPCLEAMRCGTAVITSAGSAMTEVCGDAAVYVDPENIDEIAAGLEKINSDQGLRESLIQKGIVQAGKFSWQKTADLLWNTLMTCMND